MSDVSEKANPLAAEAANRFAKQSRNRLEKAKTVKRRWMLGLRVALVALILVIYMSWLSMIRMPGQSHRGPLPAADEKLLALAEELRRDVAHLSAEIGERNVRNHPAELAAAADWIEGQLRDAGYDVTRQEYEVDRVACHNLQAERIGESKPDEIVIVGAHYDTVGTPGANDNTSGVAAVLALARMFAKRESERTIRFVAFVNEEPPYFQSEEMGSMVYARTCRERDENIVAMFSLETIGYYSDAPGSQNYPAPFSMFYPSKGNFIGFVGNTGSRDLVHRSIEIFRQQEKFPSEGCALPEAIPGIGFSDQWSFWQVGYPAVMITDTAMFRYPYYHTPEDTTDKLDFERTARVVRGLGRVIGELADGGVSD